MSVLDCKVTIDDSALFRHEQIKNEREKIEAHMRTTKHPEQLADEKGINYVEIKGDGNIGCMVNGAGLAMATMDLIEAKNGKAANFMDISGKVGMEEIDFGFQLLV